MRRPSRSSTADPASTAAPAPTATPAFAPSARSQVPPFTVMSILGRVAELRAAGHDVVSLCAGEPGGGAPPAVDAAAAAVHASGRALTYTPALGLPEPVSYTHLTLPTIYSV